MIEEELPKYDKNFDKSVFLSRIDHIYIMVLSAIMQNNLDSVRHYLSDEVSLKFDNLINEYKSKGYTRLFDEMNIKSS